MYVDVDGEEQCTVSGSSLSSTAEACSQEVDDTSEADSDNSSTNSLTAELENDLESSTVNLLESSNEGSDGETKELDMSLTETDSVDTCVDNVTGESVPVSSTADDAVNATDINSVATSVTADDNRFFIGSDRSCSDLKHDAHMSESMLISHVAMDIN